jgi:hypothetical protein
MESGIGRCSLAAAAGWGANVANIMAETANAFNSNLFLFN